MSTAAHCPRPPKGRRRISGRDLRIACLTILRRHGALKLPDLHALLHRYGYLIGAARPVTALSDAMAYETEHGRARRIDRGIYAATDRPPPRSHTPPTLDDRPGPGPVDGPTPLDPDLDEDPASWAPPEPLIPSDPGPVTNLPDHGCCRSHRRRGRRRAGSIRRPAGHEDAQGRRRPGCRPGARVRPRPCRRRGRDGPVDARLRRARRHRGRDHLCVRRRCRGRAREPAVRP